MRVTNCPQKLTRMGALAGVFLVVGMRATLPAHTLAAALCKGHALGSDGTRSALAVGFSNDFVAHGNLPSLVELAIVTHSPGLFLATEPSHPSNPHVNWPHNGAAHVFVAPRH